MTKTYAGLKYLGILALFLATYFAGYLNGFDTGVNTLGCVYQHYQYGREIAEKSNFCIDAEKGSDNLMFDALHLYRKVTNT